MWLYLLIMIFALASVSKPELAKSRKYLFCTLSVLALFVGLADMLGGYDRYLYAELFDAIYDLRVKDNRLPLGFYASEQGYMIINYLISFITGNRYIFMLIFTIIIYLFVYLSLEKYTENYPLAIVLFLALIFFFTFTYIRQIMAVVIAWYSLRYIVNRRPLQFAVCALLATTIHNSAIVFIPMYFVPAIKFNKSVVKTIMVILLIIGLSPVPGALFSSFGELSDTDSRIAQYTEDYDVFGGGFRLDYIIEAFFFLYIILRNYSVLTEDKKTIVLQNTAIVFCGILLLFVRSSSGGRLSWYYMIGLIATISSVIIHSHMPNLMKYMKIICFLLYFRIVFFWGIFLSPYKTFLTNGHRDGDIIYQRYEYDHNYDQNKFYRPVINFWEK